LDYFGSDEKMNSTTIDYTKQTRKYAYLILVFVLFLCFSLVILSFPAQASEIYGEVHNNTISWNWSDNSIGHISVDGVYVYGFVPNTTFYQNTFTDDIGTAHKLVIYEGTSWGTLTYIDENISTTTGKPQTANDLMNVLYKYIWLIIGVILIVIGKIIRKNELSLIAGFIAFIGFGLAGKEPLGIVIYGILLVISFYTSFEGI
jgi:hypothetical protein